MRKVELLAPAGSFEALRAAVENGCDAVYLGGVMFGARAFANNFEIEELKKAVAYAHVHDVSVFVTMNTIIYEDEMEEALAHAKALQEADVDAIIVQDLGLFYKLRQLLPDMELHASTQMHVHNPQGIKLLKEAGAKRVVVPRETSIEDIRTYSKLGVDLEVFVQGAICVSYSGQCLMSSMTLGRSGNRGACAQNCRMQYTLEKIEDNNIEEIPTNGVYLLSPKDLNTLEMIPQLIEAGIHSFKIEGRMKRPEYVALMTSLYRKAIDAYYTGKPFKVDEATQQEMQKVFHRGFTAGHLFHQKGSSLMNQIRPNHIGIEIGTVTHVHKGKMTVALTQDLHQGDGVRILGDKEDIGFHANRIYKNGLLVNHANVQDIIQLDVKEFVQVGSKVLKTTDVTQLQQLQKTYEGIQRRMPIKAEFIMQEGSYPSLLVYDEQDHHIYVQSEVICEQARKTPLTKERIIEQLQKTKDTPFIISDIHITMDEQVTFPIKALNQMRREALTLLEEARKQRYVNRRVVEEEERIQLPKQEQTLFVSIHTLEQFEACKEVGITQIYVENDALFHKLVKQGETVYYRYPRVMKHAYDYVHGLVQEVGGLYEGKAYICDTSLNITNAYAAAFLFHHKAHIATLSLEHNKESMRKLIKSFNERYQQEGNFACQVYGHQELMLSEYCPINACISDNDKKHCALCRGKVRYALKDIKGHRYPIMTDMDCRMHLLSEMAQNNIAEIPSYKEIGIHSFLCSFTIEDKQTCLQVLNTLKEYMYE